MNNMLLHEGSGDINKIKILIADDHELMRRALRYVLESETDMTIVAEATDGEQAVNYTSKLRPDVVIMDIQMPKIDGIEATKKIKEIAPETIVLVLTAFDDSEYILSILEAGASGYLTKNVVGTEIPNAVRAVIRGDSMLSQMVMKRLLGYALRYPTKKVVLKNGDVLTSTEITILRLIAQGASNKNIAAELDLTLNTVKKYTVSIYEKLGAHSRTEAVLNAQRAGLISINEII
jgi:two-component system response regulator DegU